MIVSFIFSLALLILAFLILAGKADFMLAHYGTGMKDGRLVFWRVKKYARTQRNRVLFASVLIVAAVACILPALFQLLK